MSQTGAEFFLGRDAPDDPDVPDIVDDEIVPGTDIHINRPDPLGVPVGPYPNILEDDDLMDAFKFSAAEQDIVRHDFSRWLEGRRARDGKSWWARSKNSVIRLMDEFMRNEYGQANVAMNIANGDFRFWGNYWKGFTRQEGQTPTWIDFFEEHTELDKTKIPLPFTDAEMTGAHVVGLGVAIAGDPLTWINPSFSGITRLGRAAEFATRAGRTGKTIDEIADVHKGVKAARDAGKSLEFSDNVKDQFLRGHRRLNVFGSPFKKPKFTMLDDWKVTRALLKGTALEGRGLPIPISLLTGGTVAGIEAAEGGDATDILKAGILGGLLGFETIRMSPGVKLNRLFPNSPLLKLKVGDFTGGKIWNPNIGIAVGEIPILKLPAYDIHGLDQSLPGMNRFATVGSIEMWRRSKEATFATGMIKMARWARNDAPVAREVIFNVGRVFKKDYRPWHENPTTYEELVNDVMGWHDATMADERRFTEGVLRTLDVEKDLPEILKHLSISEDGTIMPILRKLMTGTVPDDMARQMYAVMGNPQRLMGEDYNAGAQLLLQILGTNDEPAMRYALTIAPFSYRLAVDGLEDGIRVYREALDYNIEDLARIERGEKPRRIGAEGMTPEQAVAAIMDDSDHLRLGLDQFDEQIANLNDAAVAVGQRKPFLEAPPGVDIPDVADVELLQLGKHPPVKPDGTQSLRKAPAVRSEGEGVEVFQQERDFVEDLYKNNQTEVQNTKAVMLQGGTHQSVEAARKLDELFESGLELRKEVDVLDAQMVTAENEVRVSKARKDAEKIFSKETDDLLADTPAATTPAVDALPDAADDLTRLELRLNQARSAGRELEAAEMNQEILKLKDKSTKDYIDGKLESMDLIGQRQEAKSLLEQAKRSAELTDRAERAPGILDDADKAIAKLDEVTEAVLETGEDPGWRITPQVKRPREGERALISGTELVAKQLQDAKAAVVDAVERELGTEAAAKLAAELDIDEQFLSAEVVWERRRVKNEIAATTEEVATQGAEKRLYRNLEDMGHDEGTIRAQHLPHAYDSLKDLQKVDPDLKPEWMDVRVAGPQRAGAPSTEPAHGVVLFDGHADVEDLNYAINSYGPMSKMGGEKTGLPEHPMEWTVHRLLDNEDPETVLRALSNEPLRGLPPELEPTKIHSAAWLTPDGEILSGAPGDLHSQILYDRGIDHVPEGTRVGFVTNTGEFVSREEALALAQEAKQVSKPAIPGELDATDLGESRRFAAPEQPPMSSEAIHKAKDLAVQADDFLEQAHILVGARQHWDVTTPAGQWRREVYQGKASRLKSDMDDWFKGNPDATGPEAAELRRQRRRVEAADPTPLQVGGEMPKPHRQPSPKEPRFDRIRPKQADGTSVVDRTAMPENLQKIPLIIRPPKLQKSLELARGATGDEITTWKLGGTPKSVTYASPDEALDAMKEALEGQRINRAEHIPEANMIEVVTDAGDIYQIGLRYEIPQSKVTRKALLANGTFNGLDGLEHYRDDFFIKNAGAPQLEAFQAAEDLMRVVKGVGKKGIDDLTELPEGPVRSEVVKILARLRNAMPEASGSLKASEIRHTVQNRLKEWLDTFPVKHIDKDGRSDLKRLTPREMGLQIGEPTHNVYGAFRDNPYPIGAIIEIDGRMAKIIGYGNNSAKELKKAGDKKIRSVRFEDDTFVEPFPSIEDIQLADLASATRRGEDFWDWAMEMSKDELGVLDRNKFTDLVGRAFNKIKGMRGEAVAEWEGQLIRMNPEESETILKVSASFREQVEAMWGMEAGRTLITGWLPSYAPRVSMEATSAQWMTKSKAAAMTHSEFGPARHRTLAETTEDLNEWAIAQGRRPYFETHVGIAMAQRGTMSIEARRKHDFIERIIAKNSIPVGEIGPNLAKVQFEKRIDVMEVVGYPKDVIAEAREIADELVKRTGAGGHHEAYTKAKAAVADAKAGTPPTEALDTKTLERLLNRWKRITPEIGLYMPKGALRFYKTNAISPGNVEKGLEAARLADDAAAEEVREYLDLISNLWNVGDGEELLTVPFEKLDTILAATKRGVPAYLMPVEVAKMMNNNFQNQTKFSRGAAPLLKGVEVVDRIQKTWVNWTLFPAPMYHTRNMISDLVLANQMGHYDLPEYMVDIAHMQKTGKGTWTNRFGESVDWKEAIRVAEDAGVDIAGWSAVGYASDMADLFRPKTSVLTSVAAAGVGATAGPGAAASGFVLGSMMDFSRVKSAKGITAKLKAIRDTHIQLNDRNWIISHSKKMARLGESNRRLALMKKLYEKEGLTLFEAAKEANRVFLDFRNLSHTEVTFLRRLFPFYSWTRQNLPRQAQMLISRPHTFSIPIKLKNTAEDIIIPEEVRLGQEFYSKFYEEGIPFPTSRVSPGVYQSWLMKSWLPQSEIFQLHDPAAAAIGMLTPIAKILLETGSPLPDAINEKFGGYRGWNKNFFFNTDLETNTIFNGRVMSNRDRTLSSHFRLVNIWSKVAHNQHLPWYRAAAENILGRPYTADLYQLRRSRWEALKRSKNDARDKLFKDKGRADRFEKMGLDASIQRKRDRGLVLEIRQLEAMMDSVKTRRVLLDEVRDKDGNFNIFDDPREQPKEK